MRHVIKVTLAIVSIEAGRLELEMGLDDVEMPIEIVVTHADTHPGHLLAVGADGHSAHQSFLAKGAVVIVQKQETLRRVAGNKEVGPSILIDVEAKRR